MKSIKNYSAVAMFATALLGYCMVAAIACKQAPYNESQKTLLKIRDSEFDPKGYNQLKEPTVLVTPTNHMLLLGANGKFVLYCISEESCVTASDATPETVYGTFQQVMALLAKHTTERQQAQAKNPVGPDGKPVGNQSAGTNNGTMVQKNGPSLPCTHPDCKDAPHAP